MPINVTSVLSFSDPSLFALAMPIYRDFFYFLYELLC